MSRTGTIATFPDEVLTRGIRHLPVDATLPERDAYIGARKTFLSELLSDTAKRLVAGRKWDEYLAKRSREELRKKKAALRTERVNGPFIAR